jgi:hypothetical protein
MESNSGNSEQPRDGAMPPATLAAAAAAATAALQHEAIDPAGEGDAARRRAEATRQSRRLIAAANELLALAAELEDVARRGGAPLPREDTGTEVEPLPMLEDDVRWLRHARRTYRNRRARTAIFADDTLFGEPAWDLLLDLFIAAKERKRVPVTSACIGAAVPTTTALRWLAVLEERGLVLREADPSDARRVFVRLSAGAYAKMVSYFTRATMGDAEDTIEAARAQGRAMEKAWS